jgi:hypothetical protein
MSAAANDMEMFRNILLIEHDLFGKPLHTFPAHARDFARIEAHQGIIPGKPDWRDWHPCQGITPAFRHILAASAAFHAKTSGVDLTFATLWPRIRHANVKSKTPLETDIY